MEQLDAKYRKRGFQFLTISNFSKAHSYTEDGREDTAGVEKARDKERALLASTVGYHKMTIGIGMAPQGSHYYGLKYDKGLLPDGTIILIDREGNVLYSGGDFWELEDVVEKWMESH